MTMPEFQIALRVDASLEIGNGHLMRCLTLADELARRGARILFVCRGHAGHLCDLVARRGYEFELLSQSDEQSVADWNAHAAWLGTCLDVDAAQTATAIRRRLGRCDWLVVDHYALDSSWERQLREAAQKILVIDDLADRPHDCDLLLDQTLDRKQSDYAGLLPLGCRVLLGAPFALLRPEFSVLRQTLTAGQRPETLSRLLVSIGGVDKDNLSSRVLELLAACELPGDCRVRVVLGSTAPWLKQVRQVASRMPYSTEVLVDVSDMAGLMSDSNLAIGAAGTSAWERCCLGLPTIMLVAAENQRLVAHVLERQGAALVIDDPERMESELPPLVNRLAASADARARMSVAAMGVTDGRGVLVVSDAMGI